MWIIITIEAVVKKLSKKARSEKLKWKGNRGQIMNLSISGTIMR